MAAPFPTNYSVQYLNEDNEIIKKVVGSGPIDYILIVHFDGTVQTINSTDPLPSYVLADKTASFDLYSDGSLREYRFSDTTTADAPYVRLQFAHVHASQQALFGENNQYSSGPITYSESFKDNVKETRTFADGKLTSSSIVKLNGTNQEVFKLEGTLNPSGLASITMTNPDYPSGISVSGQGGLAGMLTLDTTQLISDNGLGLVGNDGSTVTLVGQDGGSLISDAGWTFKAGQASSLISDNGLGLVGNDGSTLVGNDGSTFKDLANKLVGNDGSTVIARDGAGFVLDSMASFRGYRAYQGPSTFTQIGDDFGEANDDEAGEIEIGGTITGILETNGDEDWFAIQLVAGKEYTFSLSGIDGGGGTLQDPTLALRKADGSIVSVNGTPVADDDGAIGRDARMTFTATTSGTYYVVATADGGTNRGAYELSVQASPTAAFVKAAAAIGIPGGSAPVMAYIPAGEYAGGFVFAWIAFYEGQHTVHPSDGHVQVQIVKADGTVVDLDTARTAYTSYSPDHAGTYNDADDTDPSITVFEDGSFIVTYTDTSYNYESNNAPKTRTTWLKMNADGTPADDGTMIPSGATSYGSSGADVMVLQSGDWLSVVHRWGIDGINNTTNVQVSINGAHPDPAKSLGGTDFQGLSAMFQALTVSATKFGTGAIAVWTDATGDGGTAPAPAGDPPTAFGVKGAVLSASGEVLAQFSVNNAVEYAQLISNGSQVADLGGGRFVVAWASFDGGRRTDSFFRIFSYDNETDGVVPVTDDIAISALMVGNATIVALPNGGFAIVYQSDSSILMQTYSESGIAIGNETVVASGGLGNGFSAVATAAGDVAVAFHQGGSNKLQYMEFNQAPTNITLSSDHVAENSAATTSIGTLSATDANGVADALRYSIVNSDGMFYIGGTQSNELRFDSQSDSVTKTLNYEQATSHSVTVRVTDSAGEYFDKTFTIHVDNVNEAPTGLVDDDAYINEGAAIGTVVATLSATDTDNSGTFTYSLVNSSGQPVTGVPFAVVGDQIKVTGSLDYETRANHYFYVRVSDGSLTKDVAYAINLNNIDDTAPTNISLNLFGDELEIDEDTAVGTTVATLRANDIDTFGSENMSYAIVNSDGTFRLEHDQNGSTRLVLSRALNFEAAAEHALTLRVSDPGSRSYTENFTIEVGNVNEAPVISGGNTTKVITVPVGTSSSTSLYSIVATDPENDALYYGTNFAGFFDFFVDSSGKLFFNNTASFANTYNFQVYARDLYGHQTNQNVQVVVQGGGTSNTAPSILGNPNIIVQANENTTQVAMIEAIDAEFDTMTWSIGGGPDASKFKLVVVSNSYVGLQFVNAPDYENPSDVGGNNTYNVIVMATDSKGAFDTQSIAVQVQNVNDTTPPPPPPPPVNHAPTMTSFNGAATASLTLQENAVLVGSIQANDTDGNPISYAVVGGADADDFIVDSSTGFLSFRTPADFESPADSNGDNVYSVTVAASDGSLSATQSVTVTVLNDKSKPKSGTEKADKLNGSEKEEKLDGKAGNDTIKALAGGDTIIGGAGADKLYGGADGVGDIFKFVKGESGTTSKTWDKVYDFVSDIDKIDLSGIDGDPATGQQDLRFVTKFKDPGKKTDGQFRVVDAGNHVNVEIDLNGDKKADMIIQVMNVDKLLASDFIV